MEINKDIADIRAAEEILHKKKKYLLCYHNFNVKNCKKSAEEIRKIAAAAGSPISIAVVPSIGGVPESEADAFREEIGKFVNRQVRAGRLRDLAPRRASQRRPVHQA